MPESVLGVCACVCVRARALDRDANNLIIMRVLLLFCVTIITALVCDTDSLVYSWP